MEEDKALTNAQKRQDPHSWFLSTASGEPPALLQEAQCRIALDLGNSCWSAGYIIAFSKDLGLLHEQEV